MQRVLMWNIVATTMALLVLLCVWLLPQLKITWMDQAEPGAFVRYEKIDRCSGCVCGPPTDGVATPALIERDPTVRQAVWSGSLGASDQDEAFLTAHDLGQTDLTAGRWPGANASMMAFIEDVYRMRPQQSARWCETQDAWLVGKGASGSIYLVSNEAGETWACRPIPSEASKEPLRFGAVRLDAHDVAWIQQVSMGAHAGVM